MAIIDKLFLTILNMSLTGAFVIAALCLARLPLKKAPKIISYGLWAVAGFRLLFPVSIEGGFSLIPFKAQTIPPDIAMQPIPRIDSGIPLVNNAVSSILPAAAPSASVNPLQIWTTIGVFVWLIGVAVMAVYGVMSFVILKRKMIEAAHIEANIFAAENIKSPFVLGVFKPRIYLPVGLSEKEKSYILLHEQTHIRRHDHIVKFVAYFILCLHWFNPLVWIAFLLMGVDMEMSCDECVLKEMGVGTKKDYSLSLLSLATDRRIIGGSPLAFGEGGIKARIKNVLNFKKTSRVIIIAAVVFVVMLSIGFVANRVSDAINMDDWDEYSFPDENFEQVFFKCNDTPYNPEYTVVSAQLMNNQNIQGLTCGTYFTLVKQDGNTWKIVPFVDGTGFDDIAYLLENGASINYDIRPEMLTVKLNEGLYRIITDVYHHKTEGEAPQKHTVWADFVIDKNAPKQETSEFTIPSEAPIKTYSLENPTKRQKVEHLSSVSLYSDGTAWLVTPPISSYILPNCTYAFTDGELLIYASIETEESEKAFGVKNGEVSVRFTVADDNTLVFQSATVPLFADERARYVSAPNISSYEPRKWFDYYFAGQMPWGRSLELELPEYPDTTFRWTPEKVTAIDADGEKELFPGMPVWNVYLADLTGDGLPEFCATVSLGSGIIDERIIVCDYALGNIYDLNDRMYYDYALYLDSGRLMVKQTKYPDPQSDTLATGELAIVDGELTATDIDRTKP
ncbi:MAG: M56 family metallopeptidase [Peptococcaceae bacterium]